MSEVELDQMIDEADTLSAGEWQRKYSMIDAISDGLLLGDCATIAYPGGERVNMSVRVWVLAA